MSITTDNISFTLKNDLSELESLTVYLETVAAKWHLAQTTVLQLNLILDELFTNIVTHGFKDDLEHDIAIHMEKRERNLQVTIIDDGCFFDPANAADPEINIPLVEKEVGGLGVFLARQYADDLRYERQKGKNIVTLIKKIN